MQTIYLLVINLSIVYSNCFTICRKTLDMTREINNNLLELKNLVIFKFDTSNLELKNLLLSQFNTTLDSDNNPHEIKEDNTFKITNEIFLILMYLIIFICIIYLFSCNKKRNVML